MACAHLSYNPQSRPGAGIGGRQGGKCGERCGAGSGRCRAVGPPAASAPPLSTLAGSALPCQRTEHPPSQPSCGAEPETLRLRTADPETPRSLARKSPDAQLQRDWGDLIFSPTELPFSGLSKPDVTLGKLLDLIFKIIPRRGWLASSGPVAQRSWPWLTVTRFSSEEREGV